MKDTDVRATGAPVRSPLRRLLPWLALAAAAAVGGLLLAALTGPPSNPLDPGASDPSGSKALARVLAGYGVTLRDTTSQHAALSRPGTVVVTGPDEYSDAQLRRLVRRTQRLVLVRPATRALHAVLPDADPTSADPATDPGCAAPGADAAGRLNLPGDAVAYTAARGTTRCYAGLVLVSPRIVVLGSADALTNDVLGHEGVAALDVNLLSADRTVTAVTWLRPGTDASGNGAQSVRDLFPTSAFRALWWLAGVALLIVLWRARRFGAVVTEPLPVVVRSIETVEGHGRLYQRAGARDRAAAALRAGTIRRLRARVALPRTAPAEQVAAVAAPLIGRAPADVLSLLAGPAPADDPALARLAADLHDLEAHDLAGATTRTAPTGGDARA